jgi:hypothetical protein
MVWLKGLLTALIVGAANAITLTIVNPAIFNFEDLGRLGLVALVSGIISVAAYLKQSPLP